MAFDAAAYAAAKKYVDDTAKGLGAVKGSPCTIKSITESDDGATLVFAWTDSDGVEQTQTAFLPRGPQGETGPKGDDGSGVDEVAREKIAALSEEIGKLGGASSWNDLTDRPFGTWVEEVALITDASVTIKAEGAPDMTLTMEDIVSGQMYHVTWNGTVYDCEAYTEETSGMPVIGNASLGGFSGGNGEPFFLAIDTDTLFVFAEVGTHTMSVATERETVRKLDEKYLPESALQGGYDLVFGTGENLDPSSLTSSSVCFIESGSVVDAVAKTQAGKPIRVALHSCVDYGDSKMHQWLEATSVCDMGWDNRLRVQFVTINNNDGETVDTWELLAIGDDTLIVTVNNKTLG